MALSVTLKASGSVDLTTSATPATEALGAITFAAGSVVVAVLAATHHEGTDPGGTPYLTATASGLTFTQEVSALGSATSADGRILSAPHAAGGSTTITIASGAIDVFGIFYAIYEVTGHNTGDPIAATAGAAATTPLDGAHSITLSGAPATTSIVIGAFHADTDPGTSSVDVGTGWSEDAEVDSTPGNYGIFQAQRRTGSTSTTVGWDDIKGGASPALYSIVAIAVEIVQAAGGGAAELGGPWFVSPLSETPFGEKQAPWEFRLKQPPVPMQVWTSPTVPADQSISLDDTAAADDSLTLAAAVPLADTAAGNDALTVAAALALTDTAAGADALTLTASLTLAETAAGADSLTVAAAVPLADTGAAVDALTAGVPISLDDTATGVDALTSTAAVPLAETATADDSLSITSDAEDPAAWHLTPFAELPFDAPAPWEGGLNKGVVVLQVWTSPPAPSGDQNISLDDTATASDFLAVGAAAPSADTAAATDTLTVAVAVTLTDTATAVDAMAAGVPISLTETASANDALAITVALALADTASVTEGISIPEAPALAIQSRVDTGPGMFRIATGLTWYRQASGPGMFQIAIGTEWLRVGTADEMFRVTTSLG